MGTPLILHSTKHQPSPPNSIGENQSFPLWETCLRKIAFVPPSEKNLVSANGVLDQFESLQFLIEVLCGLHSPLLGENEVFGQFKQFVEQHRGHESGLFNDQQKWLKYVFQEVKRIRATYIQNLGSKSYGSLLRKLIGPHPDITVVGSGQLAEEIMPWLSHIPKIQLIGRNEDRLRFFEGKYAHLQISSFKSKNDLHSKMIIAAPVDHSTVRRLLENSATLVSHIFDLRGFSSQEEENHLFQELNQLPCPPQVVFLNDLFTMIQSQREANQKIVEQIKKEIYEAAEKYILRLEHRPLGWDDLCA